MYYIGIKGTGNKSNKEEKMMNMTSEQEVLRYALKEVAQAKRDVAEEYARRMAECYETARENGQEIEQVVNNAMLYDDIYRTLVDETRGYWIKRLEAQGASLETIRKIDPDYEPETEAEWFGEDSGYRAVID